VLLHSLRVSAGAVITAAAREKQDHEQHEQDEGNDAEHLHPAWCALSLVRHYPL
jgi:hypothetical protein